MKLTSLQRQHSSFHSSSHYLQAHNRFFFPLVFLCGVWGQLSAVESRFPPLFALSSFSSKGSWLVWSHSDHFSSFSTWMRHVSHVKWDPAASSSYFWSGGLVITLESTSEQENLIKSSVFIIACVHVWAARVRWRNATLVCCVAEQKLAANDSWGNLIRKKKNNKKPCLVTLIMKQTGREQEVRRLDGGRWLFAGRGSPLRAEGCWEIKGIEHERQCTCDYVHVCVYISSSVSFSLLLSSSCSLFFFSFTIRLHKSSV